MTLNDHINKILNDHYATVYHAGCGPSLVTQLALRIRELESENADILSDLGEQRDSNVSVAELWEAAVAEARDLRESVAQLTDERDLARSALFLLRGAVQDHHDRHYLPVSYCAARPTNAPHDQALYEAAGVHWIKPEAWDHDPSTYRLAGMRAHWERRQTDAITAGDPVREHDELMDAARLELAELKKQMAGDPVRVDDTPEQPSGREILERLAELKTADMPWLTPAGLASIKDAPEQSGPQEYVKPKGWK